MPFVRRSPVLSYACLCLIALSPALAGCGGKSATPSAAAGRTSTASHATSTSNATSTPSTTATSEAPPPSSPATRAFVARADGICREANARLAASNARVAHSKATRKQPKALAAVIQQNQVIEQSTVDRLAKLKPPAALSPAWQKMLFYRRSLAAQLGVYATAVSLGLTTYGGLGTSKQKLHAQLRQVGNRAGFKDCAKTG